MKLLKTAVAGTLESSDIMITVQPSETEGISIQLTSNVEKQFGRHIRETIEQTLKQLGITAAQVEANDKGALDCTIKARTITAVYRAAGQDTYNWKEIDSWNA